MRKNTLYARRLRGDIGPLNIDPVRNLAGRVLAPAVSLDGVYQDYEAESVTQHYTLGSRMVVDERTFHYMRAGAAIVMPGTFRLAVTMETYAAVNNLLSVAPVVAVGESTVTVAVAAFQGGAVIEGELVDGWIEVMPTGNVFMWRRITANTAVDAGNFTITVDRPFTTQIEIGDTVEVHPSIYRDVQTAGVVPTYQTPVGMPPIEVQNGYYFWGQTWGPCWIAPAGPLARSAAHFEEVYFWSNGCYAMLSDFGGFIGGGGTVALISPMKIGYVLPLGAIGGPGSNMINLQLAP